jgi:hypothetical protein
MIGQIMKYHFLKYLLLKFFTVIIQAKIAIIKIISKTCRNNIHYNIVYYQLISWRNGGQQ